MRWVGAIIEGVGLGGVYLLLATTLALATRIARTQLVAMGELVVIGAFVASTVGALTQANPIINAIIVVPLVGAIAYAVQRGLFANLAVRRPSAGLLLGVATASVLQLLIAFLWDRDTRSLDPGALDGSIVSIRGEAISQASVAQFVIPLLALFAFGQVMRRTRSGRAVRAAITDPEICAVVGVNGRHAAALALGAVGALAGLAGVLFGLGEPVHFTAGPLVLLLAFEAWLLAGSSRLAYLLPASMALAVVNTVGEEIAAGWGIAAGHALALAFVVAQPDRLDELGVAELDREDPANRPVPVPEPDIR